MPRRGDPHPTKRCPLHNEPLTYTTSGTQVLCTAVAHCTYYEHLTKPLKIRIIRRKKS